MKKGFIITIAIVLLLLVVIAIVYNKNKAVLTTTPKQPVIKPIQTSTGNAATTQGSGPQSE